MRPIHLFRSGRHIAISLAFLGDLVSAFRAMGGTGSGRKSKKRLPQGKRLVRYLRASNSAQLLFCVLTALKVMRVNTSMARLFASFLLARICARYEPDHIEHAFYSLAGRPFTWKDAVRDTYTHSLTASRDRCVQEVKEIVSTLRRKRYTLQEQLGAIVLCVVARSYVFCQAVNSIVSERPRFHLTALPLYVAEVLGTVQRGSIIPTKRSRGALILPNTDLGHWSVASATADLVHVAYVLQTPSVNGQIAPEAVENLLARASANVLLYNHMLVTLQELGMLTTSLDALPQTKCGTNSGAFASVLRTLFKRKEKDVYAKYGCFAKQVKAELHAIAAECTPATAACAFDVAKTLSAVETNIAACQFSKVLHNFVYPGSLKSWRGSTKPAMKPRYQALLKKQRVQKTFKKI